MYDESFELKASTSFREFPSGSKRGDDTGKSRPDFLSPYALHRFGVHMAKGAEEYGEFNWELGQPVSQFVASLERHLNAFKRGLRDEDHLSAILYGVQAIMHFEEIAKLGNINVLRLLDRYASKNLADDLVHELEAQTTADSCMVGDDDYGDFDEESSESSESSDGLFNSFPVFVRVIRDVTVGEYCTDYGATESMISRSGDTSIALKAGTVLELISKNPRYDGMYYGARFNSNSVAGGMFNRFIRPEWVVTLKAEESWVGRQVRITRDIMVQEYEDQSGVEVDDTEIYLKAGMVLNVQNVDNYNGAPVGYYEAETDDNWYGWIHPAWVELHQPSDKVNPDWVGKKVRFNRDVTTGQYNDDDDRGETLFAKGDVYQVEGVQNNSTYILSPYQRVFHTSIGVSPHFVKPEWVDLV